MSSQDSLDRLRTLVLVCQQLPYEESEMLMRRAIEDPQRYAGEVSTLCGAGRLDLPADLVALLRRDHGALAVAV